MAPAPDVVVVGGGFAGLSAAAALAGSGVGVLLLESRPALGGRASTFTDPATGERVDNGQHVMFGCYHETFRFLERIGAGHQLFVQPSLAVDIIDAAGVPSRLQCPLLPAPLHLLAGIAGWRALRLSDRVAALRIGPALFSARRLLSAEASVRESAETVRQWLRRHGQTERLIDLLWEPLAVAALNQPIDQAAAAPFVAVLARMFGRERRDASLALATRPLDEFYAAPARTFIERSGGSVLVDAPARIECADHGGVTVRVREQAWTPRAVICAVPWHALNAVFVPPPAALAPTLAAAAATGWSPIVTVNLWFDRPVTSTPFAGLPGRRMQWVFDRRQLVGEASTHLSVVSSGAAAVVGMTNEALTEIAHREIARAFHAAGDAVLQRAVVVREKRASFSVAPGQPRRPRTETAVPGLVLAGDWIETGLPATIEGAVISGHRAAAAVQRMLTT